MGDPSDTDLVLRTRAGDRDAFKLLVTRYQGHVYGLAYSLVSNWADAQDLAQETFIRAYSNLDQLNDPAKFPAWLRRVAFSVTMNWLAAFRPGIFKQLNGKIDLDRLDIPDFHPGPVETLEKRELADAVIRAVQSLPPRYRVPLTMFHLDGLSYQKVADFLDIPLGTAKALIHRARNQLKEALAPHITEQEAPVLQEVFNEHKLPAEFATKILDKVPSLGWAKGRECTFLGSLEAALVATDHPYAYEDLMGYTGLAFRTRWFKPPNPPEWCPSCACGEMDEEISAASRATGWPLQAKLHFSPEERQKNASSLIQSINADRPALAYDTHLNMGIVYGYDNNGRSFFHHSYQGGTNKDSQPHPSLDPQNLGWMWILLGEFKNPPPLPQRIRDSLKLAIHNFRRHIGREGPGDYWYGPAAFEHWSNDILRASEFTQEQQKKLFFVSWWNFNTLHDARRAAVTFLEQNFRALSERSHPHLQRTLEIYRQESELLDQVFNDKQSFLGPWTGKTLADWTDPVRHAEADLLNQCCALEQQAIPALEAATDSQ